MKNFYIAIIALFYFLRIVLAVTTYHQDLGAIALAGKYVTVENKWTSFYNQSGQDKSQTIFNYQPLAYLIPAVVYLPFKPILSTVGDKFLNADWQIGYSSSSNFILLIYKLPMLLADFSILLLIGKFFSDKKSKQVAQLIWVINPVAIFVSSIIGQVDIIIAFLILLSYYFAKQKRVATAVVLVALSALIKPIGLILLPVYGYQVFKRYPAIIGSLLYTFLGFSVYLIGIVPFLGSAAFKHYALFADQITKSTSSGIVIASGHVIPWFFVTYSIVFLLYLEKKISISSTLALMLMSSLVFTHFHPQWLIWVIPLIIYQAVISKNYTTLLIITVSWLVVLLSFDDTLLLDSFINSNWSISSSIRTGNLFLTAVQLARSFLAGVFFWSMYNLVSKDNVQG